MCVLFIKQGYKVTVKIKCIEFIYFQRIGFYIDTAKFLLVQVGILMLTDRNLRNSWFFFKRFQLWRYLGKRYHMLTCEPGILRIPSSLQGSSLQFVRGMYLRILWCAHSMVCLENSSKNIRTISYIPVFKQSSADLDWICGTTNRFLKCSYNHNMAERFTCSSFAKGYPSCKLRYIKLFNKNYWVDRK